MTSTAIERHDPTAGAVTSIELAPEAWRLAQRVAGTEFVPAALRGKPEAVLAAMLTGHEAGVGPMQALAKIHVIDGRPSMASELMRALVLRQGHEIWVEESSITKCTVGGKRHNSDRETRVTWTLDDAQKAGLKGKQNWTKYPRAMLLARATAELCRMVFPDVLAGISYTSEELADGDVLDIDQLVANGDEAKAADGPAPTARRARASKAATRGAAPAPAEPPATPAVSEEPLLPGENDDDIVDAELVEEKSGPIGDQGPIGDDSYEGADQHVEGTAKAYTGPQIIAMRMHELGVTDRDEKLRVCGAIVGRSIDSSKDLADDEIQRVLVVLDDPAAVADVRASISDVEEL